MQNWLQKCAGKTIFASAWFIISGSDKFENSPLPDLNINHSDYIAILRLLGLWQSGENGKIDANQLKQKIMQVKIDLHKNNPNPQDQWGPIFSNQTTMGQIKRWLNRLEYMCDRAMKNDIQDKTIMWRY